jgi:hypothetical protein
MRKNLESEQRLGGSSKTTKAGKIEDGGGSGIGPGQESLDRVDVAGRTPLVEGKSDCGTADQVHLRADSSLRQLSCESGECADDLAPIHDSDPLQRALGHEYAPAPEGRRSLSNRYRAEAGNLADKPEARQEAIGLQ